MRTSELFERITRHIADAIEAGAGDFRMPWRRWGEALASPINAVSRRPYRGFNILMLWATAEGSGYSSGCWATYRQWAAVGAQVRKGEKGTPVLFWKSNPDPRGADDEGETGSRPRFLARLYTVFNADQVDGAPAGARNEPNCESRIVEADRFFRATNADIHHGGDRACYIGSTDKIWLPKFDQFRDAMSYYSVLGHETVHWTGARHRLNRDLGGRFGTDAYAMEEMVAELGSAFLAAHLGLVVEPRPDHAAYVGSWLRVLRSDPRAILSASAKAQEAVDYLIELASPAAGQCAKDGDLDELEPIAA